MHIIKTRKGATEKTKKYNSLGIATSISYLPVRGYRKEDVGDDIAEYLALFDDIRSQGLNADVTIKLIQFGAFSTIELVRENLKHVLKKGRETKTRIWFDQELDWLVDDVIDLATEQSQVDVGVCLQAYRSRSINDVDRVSNLPVRLVKGFYNDYDIRPWKQVTENYSRIMDKLATNSHYPCFATHDYTLIEKAKEILKEKDGEIQFFAGLRDDLAEQLIKEGYKVRIYVPYGRVFRFLWYGMPLFDMPRALQRLMHLPTIY